jgi:hypothetical protein
MSGATSYAVGWLPAAAVVGLVTLLSVPYVGWLIALVMVGTAVAASLAALAGALLAMPYLLVRTLRRRPRARGGARQHPALKSSAERT